MKSSGGLLAAIGFSVFWATSGVTIKALSHVDPLLVAAFRCIFALGLLLPTTIVRLGYQKSRQLFLTHSLGSRWLIGIMVSYILTVVISYQLAPVADVVLINGASPVFVLLYNWYKKEPLDKREILGALLAFLGLTIVVIPALLINDPDLPFHALGIMVGTFSSIAIAAYAILYFNIPDKEQQPDPYILNVKIFIVGTILFSLLEGVLSGNMIWHQLRANDLFLLLFLGIFSTALPTICYSIASISLPPLITTSFRLLTPILAALFALLLFGEMPNNSVIPGGILILLGLLFMAISKGKKEK